MEAERIAMEQHQSAWQSEFFTSPAAGEPVGFEPYVPFVKSTLRTDRGRADTF